MAGLPEMLVSVIQDFRDAGATLQRYELAAAGWSASGVRLLGSWRIVRTEEDKRNTEKITSALVTPWTLPNLKITPNAGDCRSYPCSRLSGCAQTAMRAAELARREIVVQDEDAP